MSKKVALMCGHGKQTNSKWDPGTSYAGYTEAALMLPITKAAVKYLRDNGVTVISDADTNNNKNMIVDVAWANKEKADIYVSIHCDYSKASSGVMPLYVSAKGKKLATALNTIIKNGMPMKSRGVSKRTDLYELNGTDMPACILETGAIKADLKILKNEYEKYGKLIAQGIMNYLGIKPKAQTTETKKEEPAEAETLYRVRKAWNDAKSQVGAFKDKDNAIAECDKHEGYTVYGENGKVIYTNKEKTETKTSTKTTTTKTKTLGEKVVDFAASQKGKYTTRTNHGKDGKKYSNKFTKYFAGKAGIDSKGQLPKYNGYIPGYCTLFVVYCLVMCGVEATTNILKTLNSAKSGYWWNPGDLKAYFKKKGLFKTDWSKIKPGAILFKGTKGHRPSHSCIYLSKSGNYIYSWDGNVNGVSKNKRKKSVYQGYVNPPYK